MLRGVLLRTLLLTLPVLTSAVSVVGGLFTVYASTDCKGSQFGTYSRTFLYTSIAYTLATTVMDKAVHAAVQSLMHHPTIAAFTFWCQAGVYTAFFLTLIVFLALIVHTACPSVKDKIAARLGKSR